MSRPAIAYINLAHLRHNYRLLKEQAAGATVMSVIKADAYGHGLHLIAPALMNEGCRCFAVTDAKEGAALRRIVGSDSEIVLLSGIFGNDDAVRCHDYRLTPALTESRQADLLSTAGFSGRIWIKVDTGMCRLGAVDAAGLFGKCEQYGFAIAGLMSHLACADEAGHPLNARQAAAFQDIAALLPADTPKSLLNSAGLVSMPEHAFDTVRPGIALYGVEPLADKPLGLKPVMRLCSRVIQLREVQQGDSISYGASFTANQTMRIATLAIGYADGLPRVLSNRGLATARVHGETAILPIVGRVCMDYTLLDASRCEIANGAEMELWGDILPAARVAEAAGTIAYELFTGVGDRVVRIAIE